MKKLLLITGLLMMGLSAHAGIDKGNGGSDHEAILVASQEIYEEVSLKLKHFFIKNKGQLVEKFPEFNSDELVQKIKYANIKIIDSDNLIDKDGVKRTCLNFPQEMIIECSANAIAHLANDPKALFVLSLHEYLGLLGVEETSPLNPKMIDGYSISKRIAGFVTKISNYDLVYQDPTNIKIKAKMEVITMVNKNFNLSIEESITKEEAKEILLYHQRAFIAKDLHKISLKLGGRGIGIYTADNINSLQDAINIVVDSLSEALRK